MASMVKIYKDYGTNYSDDEVTSIKREKHESFGHNDLNNNVNNNKIVTVHNPENYTEDVEVHIYEDDIDNDALFADEIDIQNGDDFYHQQDIYREYNSNNNNNQASSSRSKPEAHGQDEQFKCSKCQMTFAYNIYYQYHLTNSKCSGRRFERAAVTEREIKKQNFKRKDDENVGNKIYKCNVCSASFTRMFSLKRHLIIHSGDRPYKCPYCDLGFRTSGNLVIHKRIHTGEKPYKCPLCEKSFAQLTNLERHKITHTKERPHKCNECTAGFISTSDLKRHMRIHTNERPYNCSACSKSFRTSGNLKIHLRTHTNEKPYKCNICTKSFATTSNFKMHLKKHEEEPKIPQIFLLKL